MRTVRISNTENPHKNASKEQGAPLLDHISPMLEGRHVLGDKHTEGFRSMMRKS